MALACPVAIALISVLLLLSIAAPPSAKVAAIGAVGSASALPVEAEGALGLFGSALQKCDRPGYMAAHPDAADMRFPHTGYERGDYCSSTAVDAGSHYVCVDLPSDSAPGGGVYSPFWTKTGQATSPQE